MPGGDCPAIDLLVIPGGPGSRREIRNPALVTWIAARAVQSERVTSVCTGALLLGAAGLLDGLQATTHHAARDELAAVAPRTTSALASIVPARNATRISARDSLVYA